MLEKESVALEKNVAVPMLDSHEIHRCVTDHHDMTWGAEMALSPIPSNNQTKMNFML